MLELRLGQSELLELQNKRDIKVFVLYPFAVCHPDEKNQKKNGKKNKNIPQQRGAFSHLHLSKISLGMTCFSFLVLGL